MLYPSWLVVYHGFNLPLWKMMEWIRQWAGRMTFHIWNGKKTSHVWNHQPARYIHGISHFPIKTRSAHVGTVAAIAYPPPVGHLADRHMQRTGTCSAWGLRKRKKSMEKWTKNWGLNGFRMFFLNVCWYCSVWLYFMFCFMFYFGSGF